MDRAHQINPTRKNIRKRQNSKRDNIFILTLSAMIGAGILGIVIGIGIIGYCFYLWSLGLNGSVPPHLVNDSINTIIYFPLGISIFLVSLFLTSGSILRLRRGKNLEYTRPFIEIIFRLIFFISLVGVIMILGGLFIVFSNIDLSTIPPGTERLEGFLGLLFVSIPTFILSLICIIVLIIDLVAWLNYKISKKKAGGQNGNLK